MQVRIGGPSCQGLLPINEMGMAGGRTSIAAHQCAAHSLAKSANRIDARPFQTKARPEIASP